MANKSVFASIKGLLTPKATAHNAEGAPAYAYDDAHHLAQLAVTGTFGNIFYQTAEAELDTVLALAGRVPVETLAKTAIYARNNGHMKDMPTLLLAALASRDPVLFRRVFGRIVNNGKMLRNFVQIIRSGRTGRKSLGSAPKAMVQGWLNAATDHALLAANIGNDPSLADVIKMVHPKPDDPARDALYAWIIGRPCDTALLPEQLRNWLAFRDHPVGKPPSVPFQMLTQLPLNAAQWADIARTGSWQMVRQGLNSFQRKGAFADDAVILAVAEKLCSPEQIRRAKAFPYQLMVTHANLSPDMPPLIADALHDAMEIAVENVPEVAGSVAICPDVSGSMLGPVTGYRPGATSTVRFVDVAALVAAAFLRRNRWAKILPFAEQVKALRLEPRDTILSNARHLAALGGGGTDCSAPLRELNAQGLAPDLVVLVSDNQSWLGPHSYRGTAMMAQWERLRQRNPSARLVCLDIAPYGTTQAAERADIMNIGGFSDAVFGQIAEFAEGRTGPDYWLRQIEAIEL